MMNKFHYTDAQLKNDLVELTRQMSADAFRPDVVIGPGRGAYIPGVMLSHFYDVPFEGFTWQTRDGSHQNRDLLSKIIFSYIKGDPAKILLIDDINDTGKTLSDITEYVTSVSALWSGVQPIIKVATLFCKEQSEFRDVNYNARILTPDYDPWVAFPYEEWWNPR